MSSKWGPNPNTNCLAEKRCPKCGNCDSLEIETLGVIEGTKHTTRFWALVTDDGFDNPLTRGDTEEPDDGKVACPDCGFEGYHKDFDDPSE